MTSTDNGEATFWDHLEVLRWMLIRIIVVWTALLVLGFAFIPWLFDHVVMAPASSNFFLYRWLAALSGHFIPVPADLVRPFHVSVINLKLASQFFLQCELNNEKRGVRFTFFLGTVLFYMGCTVGYSLVFPLTLRFLYTYQLSAAISNQLSLESYMDNFLMLIFMMGIIFELPVLSWLLSKLGLLRRSFFSRYRRHAVVVLLVVAAFITPSSDPFTLFAVFLPIYLLWELSALLVKK